MLVISWLIPNHYRPWLTSTSEFISFGAGILFLFSALVLRKFSAPFRIPAIFILCVAIAFIPIIQNYLGVVFLFGDAAFSAIYILLLFVMLASGFSLSKEEKGEGRLFIVFLAVSILSAATISALIALSQWLIQPNSIWIKPLSGTSRPFANLAQPNHLATLLSMGMAAVLLLYEKHFFHRLSSSMLALLLLFGIALTQSRTPWLMAVIFIALWLWKFNCAYRRLSRTWALFWVAVFVSFIFILPSLAQWLQLSATASVAERAQAIERWGLYTQFFQAIVHGPLWGYGWQQVSSAQVAITPLFPVAIYTEYTHNILLDLLIWNGPILGSLIIVIAAYYLLRLAFLARSAENIFVVMVVGFFLVHCSLEYPHAYAYFLLPVGLLVGSLQADFRCRIWHLPRWLVVMFLAGSIGVYILIWQEYRLIEKDYSLMHFEKNRIGDLKADEPAPSVLLLTQLQSFIKNSRLPATRNMTTDELNELSRFAKRFTDPVSMFKYAKALALNDQLEKAYDELSVIRGLHGEKSFLQAINELSALKEDYPEIQPLLQRLQATTLESIGESIGVR